MADTATTTTAVDPSASSLHGTGGEQKAVIKNVDMAEDMQHQVVAVALAGLDKFTVEKDIAAEIKKECDKKFGPTWHVVVGKNFGSYVTHAGAETKHFIYFYISNIAFLIWKS
ncbi:SubName: Full=Probable Dynein light chain 1, cytoplasmic {ECO:0000313/EMBL:CCA77722.1} [Serendipita indica DSM 11827]|nr:SubName: Full=Probable Dynein light chain 1, cytoplasmic {ECO:0000313/EMBL:CCA77722.1} [Serendipita indica DSM 11827]